MTCQLSGAASNVDPCSCSQWANNATNICRLGLKCHVSHSGDCNSPLGSDKTCPFSFVRQSIGLRGLAP